MISTLSRPKIRGDLKQTELRDGSVLYDQDRQTAYSLNITASLIACYLDGVRSLDEIAEEVSGITGADKAAVLNDISDTVSFFQERALLEHGSL